MDSEDERLLATDRVARAVVFTGTCSYWPHVQLRLYEQDEAFDVCTARTMWWDYPSGWNNDPELEEVELDVSCRFCISRFFDAIRGFHNGTLDLTGRTPQRYRSLRALFAQILIPRNPAGEVAELTKRKPPVFQELFLLDLPPELHHEIMRVAGIEEACALGATCRTLRQISISCIFQQRTIMFKL